MDNYPRPAYWRRFFVILSGTTRGAHFSIVEKLKGVGHTEVHSPEDCDYLLVFCPIVSRTEADIISALDRIPNNKPAILVVMHQTIDPNSTISESRSLVNNQKVLLTVDCLFRDEKLYKCNRNDIMWYDMRKFLGATHPMVPVWRSFSLRDWMIWGSVFFALLIISMIVVFIVVEYLEKKP